MLTMRNQHSQKWFKSAEVATSRCPAWHDSLLGEKNTYKTGTKRGRQKQKKENLYTGMQWADLFGFR